jgi:hypothetical protein
MPKKCRRPTYEYVLTYVGGPVLARGCYPNLRTATTKLINDAWDPRLDAASVNPLIRRAPRR